MPQVYPYEAAAVQDRPIFVKIEPRDNGGVLVVAVNADGTREAHSQILAIREDGTLHLKGNLNPALGFPIGDDGAIEQS